MASHIPFPSSHRGLPGGSMQAGSETRRQALALSVFEC
jgi:hypothetical protein